MGYFTAIADDANTDEYLEHHQILGAHWGHRNGPPYPLGSGDHSESEKSAAKAAGVKVGHDSGKGSIDNVKKSKPRSKSPKKPMTPEERREAAIEAYRSGDKKKISKYIDQFTTEELGEARKRAEVRDFLTKKEEKPNTMSKEDKEKLDAIRSGDKEKVKQYADKMSYSELQEALNKVELMKKMNYVAPPPTTMDKIRSVSEKLGTFKEAASKGIEAYNIVAKVMNAANKDANWPIIGEKPKDDKDKKEDKEKEKAKEAVKEVTKEVKKSLEETYADKLKEEKLKYKNEKDFEKWKAKQEAKAAKKAKKNQDEDDDDEGNSTESQHHKYIEKKGEGENAVYRYEDDDWWDDVTLNGYSPSRDSRPISDDLSPAEEAYLESFKRK